MGEGESGAGTTSPLGLAVWVKGPRASSRPPVFRSPDRLWWEPETRVLRIREATWAAWGVPDSARVVWLGERPDGAPGELAMFQTLLPTPDRDPREYADEEIRRVFEDPLLRDAVGSRVVHPSASAAPSGEPVEVQAVAHVVPEGLERELSPRYDSGRAEVGLLLLRESDGFPGWVLGDSYAAVEVTPGVPAGGLEVLSSSGRTNDNVFDAESPMGLAALYVHGKLIAWFRGVRVTARNRERICISYTRRDVPEGHVFELTHYGPQPRAVPDPEVDSDPEELARLRSHNHELIETRARLERDVHDLRGARESFYKVVEHVQAARAHLEGVGIPGTKIEEICAVAAQRITDLRGQLDRDPPRDQILTWFRELSGLTKDDAERAVSGLDGVSAHRVLWAGVRRLGDVSLATILRDLGRVEGVRQALAIAAEPSKTPEEWGKSMRLEFDRLLDERTAELRQRIRLLGDDLAIARESSTRLAELERFLVRLGQGWSALTRGERDVLFERGKQRRKWGDDHDDDEHGTDGRGPGELAIAGAFMIGVEGTTVDIPQWAFELGDRHRDQRERFVIGIALLLAELDRADRKDPPKDPEDEPEPEEVDDGLEVPLADLARWPYVLELGTGPYGPYRVRAKTCTLGIGPGDEAHVLRMLGTPLEADRIPGECGVPGHPVSSAVLTKGGVTIAVFDAIYCNRFDRDSVGFVYGHIESFDGVEIFEWPGFKGPDAPDISAESYGDLPPKPEAGESIPGFAELGVDPARWADAFWETFASVGSHMPPNQVRRWFRAAMGAAKIASTATEVAESGSPTGGEVAFGERWEVCATTGDHSTRSSGVRTFRPPDGEGWEPFAGNGGSVLWRRQAT